MSTPGSYTLVCTSTDYDAWRVGEAPVTVAEVMKTLHTNAALSKHITSSILEAVHKAVTEGEVSSAEGGMQYSLMTPHEHVSAEELYRLKYILPKYFESAREPRAKSQTRVNTEDQDELERAA